MKIAVIPCKVKQGSTIIWNGVLRIPQYTETEFASLKIDFEREFGTSFQSVITVTGAQPIYNWIENNLGVPYSKIMYANAPEQQVSPGNQEYIFGFFPITDRSKNLYSTLRQIAPTSSGQYYDTYDNVYIETADDNYGPFTLSCLSPNVTGTDYSGGVNIGGNLSPIYASPSSSNRTLSTSIQIPFRITNDDETYVISVGRHLFSYSNSTVLLQTVTGYLFSIIPASTDPIQLFLKGEYSTIDPGQEPDPYNPGGETEPGGGTGDFDEISEPVDFPPLPALSAVDTKFITLFNPTLQQLQDLANYMWANPLFDINGFRKLFANPMDCILGLSIVPVNVPDGGLGTVTVGNISTGISMTKAASQYVTIDCGSLNVNEYWGAYLDYSPYTKAEIYLPYCGMHPIDIDDIMNKNVHVKYNIDILSGACCAMVKCGDSVLYSFIGQCSSAIPVSGTDWTQVINGALSAIISLGTMIGTGGSSIPSSLPAFASGIVSALKPNIQRSGNMGGTGGMLAIQSPYLILTRPRQALPRDQNKFMGYPSYITENLGNLVGYSEIYSVHLEGIPATDAEIEEIEQLLKAGVIF